jgi:ribosomal protein L14
MKTKTPYVKHLHLPLFFFFFIVSNTLCAQLLFQSSFEGTNWQAGFQTPGQYCQTCAYTATQATPPNGPHPNGGPNSFRAEVRSNTPAVSSGWRSELVPNYSGGDAGDMWYGFSVYFDAPVSGGYWTGSYGGHFIQWHPDNSSGSLVFGLWGSNGEWDLTVNQQGDATADHYFKGGTTPNGGTHVKIVAGVWHDVVLHVNWSTGVTQFWLNGVLQNDLVIPWSSGPGRYLKFGMNRWGNCSGGAPCDTWVIYYDNLKIGRGVTYADVAPSSASTTNQPPVANAGADKTLTLPVNSTSLVGSGSDVDGTIASYAWTRVSGPATFTMGTANAATTTLSNLVAGVYTFRLTVTDNQGATGTDDVIVTVNAAANQPPTANAGSDITLTLPANTTTLVGSGSDADGTIASYAWTRVSGPATFTMGTANAATTTLSNLVAGVYTFRLTVTDNQGATGTDNVIVTVNAAVNQPPTANAGSDITMTLPVNSTTLNGSGTDADGTIAGYAWARVSGPATYTLGTANAATTTLSNLVQGVYTFSLTVTDNSGATATDNVIVTVNAAVNQPPAANAGNNITLTLPVNSTTLNGSGTDADGTIVSYAWTRVSGPATFTLGTAGAATTTLSNLVQGVYTFRLTVADNNGATGTDDVIVTVNAAANQPPIANAGSNITITLPTNNTTLNGSGTDADGTITGYAWTRVSGPTTFTLGTAGAATTTLTNLVAGTYVFRLTVTDNNGATGTDDVTVTVNASAPSNQSPIAIAGNNVTLNLPANSTTLNGTASFDPDGTIASYAWSKVSGPGTFTIGNANAATTTLTNLIAGTYVFQLTVTDNNGATDDDNITVIVSATPNQPPTANAGNNITMTLPLNSTNLNGGSSTDADGTITTYGWTRVSGPATYTLANAGAAATGLSNLVAGVYTFRLTVTDNDGATSTDDVTVTVNAAVNQSPTANAGSDITLTLPVNATILTGSGYDPDGTIASYGWTRVSGPATYTLVNAGAAATGLDGLVQGVYVFRLTVTDNSGASATDVVTVTVNAASNQAPTANAGADITITLPTNTTTLYGSGSDADGTIASYGWAKVSGPASFTLANTSSATTGLYNLVQGVYVFRLTITDNSGATATDNVTVTVNAALPNANQPPVARTENDITLTLPLNSTQVHGNTSSDPDGVIMAYAWTEVSGPGRAVITNATSSIASVSDLTTGIYLFELKVTDDQGATSTKVIKVIVNNKPGQGATMSIYPNPSTGIVNIQYVSNTNGKYRVTIYDASRKLVKDEVIDKTQVSMITTIDVSSYERGVYFIQFTSPENERTTKQLVKM